MKIESPHDNYLQEDLEFVANSELQFELLYNKTILITGATGLIGSQLVNSLLCMNRIKNANIKVLALVRNMHKAETSFRYVLDNSNLKFIYADITEKFSIDEEIDYIIHTASVTTSKFFIEHPVETIDVAISGTKNVLELAREKDIKGLVYLSSMEVFGITDPELESVSEDDLGYIDIHNVRSCYPESKRLIECLCSSYASEYKIPVKIARLSQTFGAGIGIGENRVFAQFARSVINGNDIVLHTMGNSIGNYCYTRDVVIAILLLLIKGNPGEAYNVSNEESNMTIFSMAQMVVEKIAKGNIKVILDVPDDALKYGYAPDTKMKMNTSKMRALGWRPEIGLEESYQRMIGSMLKTK